MPQNRATYQSNNSVVYSCKYHVVWYPKYRRNVLRDGAPLEIVKQYIEQQKHA